MEFHTIPGASSVPSGGADRGGGGGALTCFFGKMFIIEGIMMVVDGLSAAFSFEMEYAVGVLGGSGFTGEDVSPTSLQYQEL